MPFELGGAVNTLSDLFLDAPIVATIANDPMYTALTITIILVMIVLLVFRDVESDESVITMSLRVGIWSFLITAGVLFLQNKVLMRDKEYDTKNTEYDDVFKGAYSRIGADDGVTSAILEDSIMPVNINTDF